MNLADITARLHLPQLGPGPDRLALTEVHSNLTFTANTVTAWYTLPEQRWPFRSDSERQALLDSIASQYAGLAGHHLHLRHTTVPYPAGSWARALAANATPLPDVTKPRSGAPLPRDLQRAHRAGPPAPSWQQHMFQAEEHLRAGEFRLGRTHLGVIFTRRASLRETLGRKNDSRDAALAKKIDQVTQALAAPGLFAAPSTAEELLWLIYRSVGLGLNPPTHRPGSVRPDDIAEFLDAVDCYRGRYASTTRFVDRRTGETSYAAVLAVGRMEPLTIPEIHLPWAFQAQQAPFEVEWSSRVDILGPAATRGSIGRQARIISFQRRDYAEHNYPEPPELARLVGRAAHINDEIDTGLPVDACRAHGHHRLAVTAATEEECLERVRDLIRLYDQELHVTLVHPKAQLALTREFIPGEPVANTGYLRRMPTRLLAAALPQAAGPIGDGRGDFIGYTTGAGRRPVFLDLHYPMEVREQSGLAVFVAKPGGGKSTLLGALGYLAARRGVQVTMMDPSGPLARLCEMPELRPYARVVNLVGAQLGTLAPYAMIPTPRREDYLYGRAGDEEYEAADTLARAERRELVADVINMLLPPQLARDTELPLALLAAIRMVPDDETSTLDQVVRALDVIGHQESIVVAKRVASALEDLARMPHARLFFGSPPPGTLTTDAAFTVLTMNGLQLPDPATDRAYWSMSQRLAVPVLHLAHHLAVRRCYGGRLGRRRLVGLDESHFMAQWPSGRAFLIRLSRDSRKWNIAALLASQNPIDILGLDVQNLVSTTFVGKIADNPTVTAQALEMLGLPVGDRYEPVLAGLSQQLDTSSMNRLGYREFVIRDVDDRVQKVRIDLSYIPGLLAALDTTPGGTE